MPKKKISATDILTEYARRVDPTATVQANAARVIIRTNGRRGPQIIRGDIGSFNNILGKNKKGYFVEDTKALAEYMKAIIGDMTTGRTTFESPRAMGITLRSEPEPEPPGAEESEAAKSKLSKGPVSFGKDSIVVLIDPQGHEVDPDDIPELSELGTASLIENGYHGMIVSPAAAARKAKETRGRELQEELGRQAMVAQILQATRSGELKSSEVFEISSDLAEGELTPEKLKKIGTQILKARKRALEEFVGKRRQAKALGPRALKRLLVGLYGK